MDAKEAVDRASPRPLIVRTVSLGRDRALALPGPGSLGAGERRVPRAAEAFGDEGWSYHTFQRVPAVPRWRMPQTTSPAEAGLMS